jgi:hypothetical protein
MRLIQTFVALVCLGLAGGMAKAQMTAEQVRQEAVQYLQRILAAAPRPQDLPATPLEPSTIETLDALWIVHFPTADVVVNKSSGKARSLNIKYKRLDDTWSGSLGLTNSQARELALRYAEITFAPDTARVTGVETWGAPGADVWGGGPGHNLYRVQCRLYRQGIWYGWVLMDIDALTGLLLYIGSSGELEMPSHLTPAITREEALSIAMSSWFSVDPECEILEEGRCELAVLEHSYLRPSSGLPPHVQAAIAEKRNLLAYKTLFADLSRGPDRHPYSHVIVDAMTGHVLERSDWSYGIGGGSAKKKQPLQWDWGTGPTEVVSKNKSCFVPESDVRQVRSGAGKEKGIPIILRRGRLSVQAWFHPKSGLVSKRTGRKITFARPTANLLAALRKLTGSGR